MCCIGYWNSKTVDKWNHLVLELLGTGQVLGDADIWILVQLKMHNLQLNSALYIVIFGKNFNLNICIWKQFYFSHDDLHFKERKKNEIFTSTENAIIRVKQYHTNSLRLFSEKTSILQTDIGTLKSFVEKVNFKNNYQSQ